MANEHQSGIDYVLIYFKYIGEDERAVLSVYIKNLIQQGLKTLEEEIGEVLDNYVCIKIHAPDSVLESLAEVFKIALTKNNPHYKIQKIRWKWFANILTRPNEDDPIVRKGRANDTLSGKQPTSFTASERIYIVHRLLTSTTFGNLPGDKGFEALIKKRILLDAYPLHDSTYQWTEEGPLSDRQLLARYWASLRCFYNYQPLNLIEKHYGPEIGFYFAWMGFYIQLLIPAAILGLLCFFAGIVLYTLDTEFIQKEVCDSKQLICPVCPSVTTCDFVPLKNSCEKFKIAYVLENNITVDYSMLMIFWGVIFLISWRRKEAMLKMRWNIHQVPLDRVTRPQFIQQASLNRISSITGEKEYYFSIWHRILSYTLSYSVFSIIFVAYVIGLVVVKLFRLNFHHYGMRSSILKGHLETYEMFASSLLSVVIIYIFKLFKNRLCQKLTQWENPRTDAEFKMRYQIKAIIVSFGNTLFPVIYLAYFKGKFFTHPGDATQWSILGIGRSDVCPPSGCLVDLSVQLMMIMGVDNMVKIFKGTFLQYLSVRYNRSIRKYKGPKEFTRQWEEDFNLLPVGTNFLDDAYIDMAIQHGYMSLFLVAFPLAPVFSLVNSVLKMRFDAIRLLKRSRRVIPRYMTGIDQWNTVFQVITLLGAIANPLLITFGSNFVPRILYRSQNGNSLTGFINSTLSEFAVDDFPETRSLENVTTCLYFGRRYPPSHSRSYELTSDFWILIAVKSIIFICLENVCLLFSLFLNYVVPTIPRKVEIKMEYEQEVLREMRLRNNAI
ncbi:unnamed protein product [Phaedon cochleariae]|uniref:Anoctamin n=1 Tax=Phaedon cochleariae TaxID=80249 RepID=A0A9P0GLC4_PHACE|nr:unnamed protein product [Phaedon cochleariae]